MKVEKEELMEDKFKEGVKEYDYVDSNANMFYDDAISSEGIEVPPVCDILNIILLNNRALFRHILTQCKQLLSKKDEIDKLGRDRGLTHKQLIGEAQRLGIFYQIYNPDDPKQKEIIHYHTNGNPRANADLIDLALNHLKEEKIQTNIHICLLALNDSDFVQLIQYADFEQLIQDAYFEQLIQNADYVEQGLYLPYKLLAQNIKQIIDFMNIEKNNFIQQNGEEKFPFTDKTFNSSVHIAMANILSATITEKLLVHCPVVNKWYNRTRQVYEKLGIELEDFSIFIAPLVRNVIDFIPDELLKRLEGIQISTNMLQF